MLNIYFFIKLRIGFHASSQKCKSFKLFQTSVKSHLSFSKLLIYFFSTDVISWSQIVPSAFTESSGIFPSMTQQPSLHLLPFQTTCLYFCFIDSTITNCIWEWFFSFLIFFLAQLVRRVLCWPLCTILFPVVFNSNMFWNPVCKITLWRTVCHAYTNGMCKLWGLLMKEQDYRGITGSYREALRYLRPQVSIRPQ